MHDDASHNTQGWPTTLRFSRRLGDAVRGADYASAIEGPPRRRPLAQLLAQGLGRALGLRGRPGRRVGLATRSH